MDNVRGVTKINSCQNGLLIQATLCSFFNNYLIGINPKDGYKITCFAPDNMNLDGRILDPACRNPMDPRRVSDELLEWHFRQCVLANMKGAGEPLFEHDFPPGTDMIAEIREGPMPKERFETEIAARLKECHS
ncbi:hypothetical protein Plec18170_002011 [Paecilomyces lecythidis]